MSMLRLKEAIRSINDSSDQRFDSQRTEVSLNELLICNLRENTIVQELFSKFTNTHNIEKNSSELIFKKIAMDDKPQPYLYSFVIADIESRIRSARSSEDITRWDSCCHEGGILITSRKDSNTPRTFKDSNLNKLAGIKSKRRTDFVCDKFLPGVPLTLDVAVTDPRQFVLVKPQPGKAPLLRRNQKSINMKRIVKIWGIIPTICPRILR